MRPIGLSRKIDELGRIVIPADARRALGWSVKTPIEICKFGKGVYLYAADLNDTEAAAAQQPDDHPVLLEMNSVMRQLSDDDLLLVLDLVHRLAREERK